MNTTLAIGRLFKHQKNIWKISTEGIPGWWGCVCLKTNSFVSFSTEELNTIFKNRR